MAASRSRSVWLDWQPKQQILEEHAKNEPPKPPKPNSEGFAGSILRCQPTFNASPDSMRWVRDFHFWVWERCRFLDRYWSPVADLHADFVNWNVHRDCDLPSFRALLDEAGIYIEEVRGVLWCHGLLLSRLLSPELAEAKRPRQLDERDREG